MDSDVLMCKRRAEWVLCGDRPEDETYSCTSHLSQMVADDTREILALDPDNDCGECCHLSRWEYAVFLLREFMLTIWWAGPPVDWDEQVREAVANE